MPEQVLVVDDDPSVQSALHKALVKRGYEVERASSAEAALEKMKASRFDLIVLDVRLPGISGMEAIPLIREIDPLVVIIVITGHDTKEMAMQAIQSGAYDYFPKPFSFGEVEIVIKRALEKRRLQAESDALRETLIGVASRKFIGRSDAIVGVMKAVERIAPTETTVLITGESGTGKELIADLIHYRSRRVAGPYVQVNCAAIPEGLLESELFGYEKGAFTGATSAKPGMFEWAQHGTILLDEVGDMPLSTQVKILRVVEQKQVERLGARSSTPVDIRIVAATNQELPELIRERKFREDLYFRLNVASIRIPPLRERKEDIPLLVQHFLHEVNRELGTRLRGVSPQALEKLLAHPWPGNVRELVNVLKRAALMSRGDLLDSTDMDHSLQGGPPTPVLRGYGQSLSLWETVQQVEKSLILDALHRSNGQQSEAAKLLGVGAKNLWKKIRKHGIEVGDLMADRGESPQE
jgi:two-component system response regulator AtoC